MKKTLKTEKKGVIATLFFVFVMLGVSISFMSTDKANAETADSTSKEVSATDFTESPTIIVTVPVFEEFTKPTEPTEPAPTQGETGDIKWVVNDDKQLIISKNNTGETCSTGDWYETYIVYDTVHTLDPNVSYEVPIEKERLLDTPWSKCDYNSVIIEEGVTEIGDYSFYGAKFDEISLPESLRVIKRGAFRSVNTSGEFIFPSNLNEIGVGAFRYSKFDFGNAVFPESLKKIKTHAFSYCLGFESIDLSKTLIKEIEWFTFDNCENLKTVTFSKQLESIGAEAFLNTSINEYTILSKDTKISNNSMGYIFNSGYKTTKTKFFGYTESTVAEYASQSDDFTFVPLDDGKGDLNFDGLINKLDVQILQEHLTNKSKMDDNAIERADILNDGSLNSFDVVKLRRIILEN